MQLPRLLYTDLSKYTFTGPAVESGYSLYNLNNYNRNSTVRFLDASGTLQYLIIDTGNTLAKNAIVLDNVNFDTCMDAGTIRLESSTSDDFVDAFRYDGLFLEDYTKSLFMSFPETTRRYFRLCFDGTMTSKCEIGNIFISKLLKFNFPYLYGYKKDNYEYKTNDTVTISGLLRASNAGYEKLVNEFNFKFQTDSVKNEFIDFIKCVRGKAYPFYFTDSDGTTTYVHMANDYTPAMVESFNLSDISNLTMKGELTDAVLELPYEKIYEDELIL